MTIWPLRPHLISRIFPISGKQTRKQDGWVGAVKRKQTAEILQLRQTYRRTNKQEKLTQQNVESRVRDYKNK